MGPVGAPAPGLTNVAWYLNCQLCKLWVAALKTKAGEFLTVESRVLRLSCQKCHRVQMSSRQSYTPKTQFVLTFVLQTWPDLRCGRQTRWDSAGAFLPLQWWQEHIAGIYQQVTNTQSYTVLCIKSGAENFERPFKASVQLWKVHFTPADPDGPGWAIVAFATPEIAKALELQEVETCTFC